MHRARLNTHTLSALVLATAATATFACTDDGGTTSGDDEIGATETDSDSTETETETGTETGTDTGTSTTESETADTETADTETTETTESETTESETTESETTAGLTCGDGVLDDGEECDNGDANADDAACTNACTNAVCGDGLVFAEQEACDDANDDETDDCTTLCAAPACDDGILSGDETDLDCGGSCDGCDFGLACVEGSDCASTICSDSACSYAPNCMAIKDGNPDAADGLYTVDLDGPGPLEPLEVLCDMTTDGGGWTRCAQIDETGVGDVCVTESDAYLAPEELLNNSFCGLMFTDSPTSAMLIHNLTPDGDQDFGEGDMVRITWGDSPMTLDTYDNHPIEDCRELTSDTVFADCQYSSHSGQPWQNATWSFTRGSLDNGYSGNANRRVILGPTFQAETPSCTWHNFGAETNARNAANTWRLADNVGDLYLR